MVKELKSAFLLVAIVAALLATSSPASAQAIRPKLGPSYVAPRTPDGKPDLQGIWETRNAAAFDVSEVAEGHEIPYLPEALDREQKGPRVDPIAHCKMSGVPRITYMPFPFQIMQRPGYVVFMYEYLHDQRIIQTNSRPHIDGIDLWLGDSVGHWEGNTLVVDVTNLDERSWLDSARHTHATPCMWLNATLAPAPTPLTTRPPSRIRRRTPGPGKSACLSRNTEPGFELREQECTEGDNGRPIHPLYRPAPKGDPLELTREYPVKKETSK